MTEISFYDIAMGSLHRVHDAIAEPIAKDDPIFAEADMTARMEVALARFARGDQSAATIIIACWSAIENLRSEMAYDD